MQCIVRVDDKYWDMIFWILCDMIILSNEILQCFQNIKILPSTTLNNFILPIQDLLKTIQDCCYYINW